MSSSARSRGLLSPFRMSSRYDSGFPGSSHHHSHSRSRFLPIERMKTDKRNSPHWNS